MQEVFIIIVNKSNCPFHCLPLRPKAIFLEEKQLFKISLTVLSSSSDRSFCSSVKLMRLSLKYNICDLIWSCRLTAFFISTLTCMVYDRSLRRLLDFKVNKIQDPKIWNVCRRAKEPRNSYSVQNYCWLINQLG